MNPEAVGGGGKLDQIDLAVLGRLVFARRWLVVCTTAIVVCMGALYLAFTPKQFRATALLLSASATNSSSNLLSSAIGQLGGLGSLVAGTKDPEVEEALAILSSRSFLEEFIHDNSLMEVLYSSDWDAKRGVWRGAGSHTLTGAARLMQRKMLQVEQDRKTGLIKIAITWRDRDEAARIANLIISAINSEMRARALRRVSASLEYLRREMEGTTEVPAREAINRLIEAAIKQRMLVNVTGEYSLKIVDSAVVPEVNEYISPRPVALLAGSVALGLLAGVVGALLLRQGPGS